MGNKKSAFPDFSCGRWKMIHGAVPWLLVWVCPISHGMSMEVESWLLGMVASSWILLWRLTSPAIFAFGLLSAAVLSAVIGVIQYLGMDAPLVPWISASQPGLAYGNLRQRNHFGTLMGLGLMCLMVYVYRYDRWSAYVRGGGMRLIVCLGLFGAGVLMAVGAALSSSRTTLVQWMVMALCIESVLWCKRTVLSLRVAWVMRWSTVCYGLTLWVAPTLLNGMNLGQGETMLQRLQPLVDCGSRWILWSDVVDLVSKMPWLGWGWGGLQFAHFADVDTGSRFCELVGNAHNLPLHLAVTLGLPVAVSFCSLAIYGIWRGRPWSEAEPYRILAWGVLFAIGIHSMLEYPLWYGPFQLTTLASVAILWCIPSRHGNSEQEPQVGRRQLNHRAGTLVGLFGITASVLIAWDYACVSQVFLPQSQRSSALVLPAQSWFFQDYLDFAQFTTTPVQEDNAAMMVELGQRMLHFSPEPRVVVILLRAAQVARREDVQQWLLPRFAAAYPAEYAAWRARQAP